ncbi:Threonine/homoserine/homoserine lactone efflux protein [Salinimicrobium catena]|uniref:Threonine/homoserine/homoserine lactone efflux protein n=1 Tax=Salinimicrobium catena TaxID=390640 RepID=A0A1H5JP63_9FLAO|nr:LysE family transporter [Salinimicrobium catena]SDK88712.1 Threonine/homoserine/homoserine lactone efflux protein [Salinimicrobium catena]SEE53428.1 Threonine/homoserine/homoserine lactone efflux protein [Salinimicrobium catena]
MEETKIFLITYFAALLGVVPPGLVNMTVAKTCVQKGKKNGIYVAAGASFVVLIQATIAVLLTRYIFDNPFVRNVLLRAGLVIFIILMVYFLIMAKYKRKKVEVSPTSGVKSIFKGFMIGALNIFPIPYFVALSAALNVNGQVEYLLLNNTVFVLAASLGTFTTLYLYALFFAKIEAEETFFAKYSNYFMAGLMLILVIITFIRIFY